MGAGLTQVALGHCVPMSSYVLPQLAVDSASLYVDEEMGSWFGKFSRKTNRRECVFCLFHG